LKGSGRREKLKGKRRVRTGELAGFVVLTVFIVLVAYLMISPPTFHSGNQPEVNTSTSQSTTANKPTLKAALVDQLSTHSPSREFIDTAEDMMFRSGFDVDIYGPNEVTVGLYGSLATHGYKLIVFRVHAGVEVRSWDPEIKGKPVGLFTTETYSELKYPQEQLYDLVTPAQAFNDSEVVFAVNPEFIRQRSADYGGAVIVLTGCFGLFSQDLPQAFISRGASVVIGWDGLVDVKHTDQATLTLLRMMLVERMSIGESVSATMKEVGPDPVEGSVLSYYPPQKGSLTFSDLLLNKSLIVLDSGLEVGSMFYDDKIIFKLKPNFPEHFSLQDTCCLLLHIANQL